MRHFDPRRGYDGAVSAFRPMDDDELRRRAPSIFAEAAHDSRSERYAYIPTSATVAGLRSEGFEPYAAKQGNSRVPGKRDFTKHMIRFRHRTFDASAARVGDSIPEIVLINSHDGTTAYQLMSGVFRLACLNGLIVGDKFETVKVHHTGDAVAKVIEGAYTVLGETERVLENIDGFQSVTLSEGEQIAFARAALRLRYETEADAGFGAAQLIRPRRAADRAPDLWTVFNRAQEGLIRGGQDRRNRIAEDGRRIRPGRAREVNGIDQDKAINRALWTLAEEMRALKS